MDTPGVLGRGFGHLAHAGGPMPTGDRRRVSTNAIAVNGALLSVPDKSVLLTELSQASEGQSARPTVDAVRP